MGVTIRVWGLEFDHLWLRRVLQGFLGSEFWDSWFSVVGLCV